MVRETQRLRGKGKINLNNKRDREKDKRKGIVKRNFDCLSTTFFFISDY